MILWRRVVPRTMLSSMTTEVVHATLYGAVGDVVDVRCELIAALPLGDEGAELMSLIATFSVRTRAERISRSASSESEGVLLICRSFSSVRCLSIPSIIP